MNGDIQQHTLIAQSHRRRLVKYIGGNQNIVGQRMSITDEIIGVSQLLGASFRAALFKVYGFMPMVKAKLKQ